MKKYLFLFLLFIAFIANSADKLKFTGENLFDNKTGIMVTADEDKKYIAVSNQLYHYVVILPYSVDWELSVDKKYCLYASNDVYNFSIELFANNYKSDYEYFNYLENQFKDNSDSLGIINLYRLNYKNYILLKTEVEILKVFKKLDEKKYKDMISVNLYSTKSYNNERYLLHFSIVKNKNDNSFDEKSVYDYLTEGFFIDFERE
jgi:hypothetical protein